MYPQYRSRFQNPPIFARMPQVSTSAPCLKVYLPYLAANVAQIALPNSITTKPKPPSELKYCELKYSQTMWNARFKIIQLAWSPASKQSALKYQITLPSNGMWKRRNDQLGFKTLDKNKRGEI